MRLEDVRVDMGQREAQRSSDSNGGSNSSSSADSTSIAEIIVDRAIVEFPRKEKPPLRFNIHQLTLGNVVPGKPTAFHVTLDNPLPPGRVSVDGQFGPWNESDIAATPLSGTYIFSDAKLASLGGHRRHSLVARQLRRTREGSSRTRHNRYAGLPGEVCRPSGSPAHRVSGHGQLYERRRGFAKHSGDNLKKPRLRVAGEVSTKTNAHARVAALQSRRSWRKN